MKGRHLTIPFDRIAPIDVTFRDVFFSILCPAPPLQYSPHPLDTPFGRGAVLFELRRFKFIEALLPCTFPVTLPVLFIEVLLPDALAGRSRRAEFYSSRDVRPLFLFVGFPPSFRKKHSRRLPALTIEGEWRETSPLLLEILSAFYLAPAVGVGGGMGCVWEGGGARAGPPVVRATSGRKLHNPKKKPYRVTAGELFGGGSNFLRGGGGERYKKGRQKRGWGGKPLNG